MSEADTPNNQPLPELTTSTDDDAADWSAPIEESEEVTIVNLFQISEANDTDQPLTPEPTLVIESIPIVEDDDSTTETSDDAGQDRNNDADWFALAQKMRQRNRRLLDQVTQLKQALNEKQETLNLELMRSQDQEIVLVRQTEELNTLQTQLTRLFHTLESSHQAAQRQQILIETLSEQLQSSQERVAQLERECALTQQRYNEQSHQLLQAANTCRELRTRLHRQQQQTLQFKVALEKCLEMPPTPATAPQPSRHQRDLTPSSVVPKAPPIQPWSAEPELVEDESYALWNNPVHLESLSNLSSSEAEPFEIRPIEAKNQFSTADTAHSTETTFATSQHSTAAELELEEQLLAEMTSLAEASGLSELVSDLVQEQGQLTPESKTTSEASDESVSSSRTAEETPLLENREEFWEETANPQPEQPNDIIFPQSNWPSPVLYPLRRPKKIKSLAAIDLPSFPPYHSY